MAKPVGRPPLEGIRVLDVGTRISAPFCAGLLGEMGADVIKVEDPQGGDDLRAIGPFEGSRSLWFAVEGRGRKSVTCNLRTRLGQLLFRRLAETADVLVENFSPGTMERWGLGPETLPDHLVYARISAYGQTGPYSGRKGLDRVAVAFGGLLHLTGDPQGPPFKCGVNISDYLTGVFTAESVMAALYARDATAYGRGQVVDASLYGSVLRILEWTIAAHDRLGVVRDRSGNRSSNAAPADEFLTLDGRYAGIVAAADGTFTRLCQAMGRPELAEDPHFATAADRVTNRAVLEELVTHWTSSRTLQEVESLCLAEGVPIGVENTATEIASDPHVAARGDLVIVQDPVLGPVRQQAPYPAMSGFERQVPCGAPELGQDNEAVWCRLVGLDPTELAEARAQGAI